MSNVFTYSQGAWTSGCILPDWENPDESFEDYLQRNSIGVRAVFNSTELEPCLEIYEHDSGVGYLAAAVPFGSNITWVWIPDLPSLLMFLSAYKGVFKMLDDHE